MKKFKVISSICMIVLIVSLTIFSIVYFSHKNKEGKVVVTIFPIYDICREILGTDEDIVMLQDNGADMHSYQATASDIATISKAELFIMVGGESDSWVGNVIRSANNVNLSTVSLMDIVAKVEESDDNISQGHDHHHEEGEDHHHEEGEEHHEEDIHYDEHVWLSIKNMITATNYISSELISVFPERTEIIKENTEIYLAELYAIESEYRDVLEGKDAFYLVADRFPFIYLMNDYGLPYHAAFSGCSSETDASAETMSELINRVREKNLKSIYITETSDGSIAEQVKATVGRNDIEILTINSCQSVSADNLESLSYVSIMRDNLEKLKRGIIG